MSASGLNVAYLMGKVDGDAPLRQRDNKAISVFKLLTVVHGSNGKDYPTTFHIIMHGDVATNNVAKAKDGARLFLIGTHETGRVYNDAEGKPARTNDFVAVKVLDTATEDFNEALLFGNIGRDAVLQNADSENPFSSLSLATNLYAGKGEDGKSIQRTLWNRLNINGKQATGLNDSLKKGVYIGVRGEYRYSKPYVNNSGETMMDIQFAANNIVFGGSTFKPTAGQPAALQDLSDPFAGLGDAPSAPSQPAAPAAAAAGAGEPVGADDSLFDNF